MPARSRRRTTGLAAAATAAAVAALSVGAPRPGAAPDPAAFQQSALVARSVLPASSVRPGSPASGAFLPAGSRADAAANGIAGPAQGSYFANQPVQGVSALVPTGAGTWFAMSDNGYGARENSADWQLVVNEVDPRFGKDGGPQLLRTIVLRDPDKQVPWRIVCDPGYGRPLPPFSFNAFPATPPAACGTDPGARLLTGFDFDLESMQIAADGTLWFGEEFGPFLLHTDRTGRLLSPPIAVPEALAPQNPTLDPARGDRPNLASSRGFEGMAISPDRRFLYPLFEGSVGADDAQTLRILQFDLRTERFTDRVWRVRLEMPGAKVNLATLKLADGTDAYPGTSAPTGTGGQAIGELTAINDHQFLLVERDSNGDGVAAPRFKKVFLLDTADAEARGGYVSKTMLVDLMAVPDPQRVGGDGDFFRFPFVTIESVHPVDARTIVVASDNNFPFSNGRSRSKTNERTGPLAADDNEIIVVRLGAELDLDPRVLTAPTGR